ncbi:MAG: hypothetical protein ACT4PU_11660 [Planctomycetota bacterium]
MAILWALPLILLPLTASSCDQSGEPAIELGPILGLELTNKGGCDFGGPRPPFVWRIQFSRGGQAYLDDYTTGSLQQAMGTIEPSAWAELAGSAEAVDWDSSELFYTGGTVGPDVYSVRVVRAQCEQSTYGTQEALPASIAIILNDLSKAKSRVEWRPREQ